MQAFGIQLSQERNNANNPGTQTISGNDTKCAIFLIPTDEELAIAQQTLDVLDATDGQMQNQHRVTH